jgi:hypothetical protein
MIELRSEGLGAMICCRENPSSCRVICLERSAAFHDFVQMTSHDFGLPDSGFRQVGEAEDDRQHVVEVMRHTSGEPPDRLHFLSPEKVRLQFGVLLRGLLAFRDIASYRREVQRGALLIANEECREVHVDQRTCPKVSQPGFPGPETLRPHGRIHFPGKLRTVHIREEIENRLTPGLLKALDPHQVHGGVVQVHDIFVQRRDCDELVAHFHDRGEFLQFLQSTLPRGDVPHGADSANRMTTLPLPFEERLRPDAGPANGPVRQEHAVFDVE